MDTQHSNVSELFLHLSVESVLCTAKDSHSALTEGFGILPSRRKQRQHPKVAYQQ